MKEDPTNQQNGTESPSPDPRSESDAAASSKVSSGADSPFIEAPGPGFDPGAAAAPPPDVDEGLDAAPDEGWDVDAMRSILIAKGAAVHGILGVGAEDWIYTEADLNAIAPPLCRILDRYDVTRAAAGTGDEIAVIFGFGAYVSRSYMERRAVLAELAAQEEVPSSGVAAPAGSGPPEPKVPPPSRDGQPVPDDLTFTTEP